MIRCPIEHIQFCLIKYTPNDDLYGISTFRLALFRFLFTLAPRSYVIPLVLRWIPRALWMPTTPNDDEDGTVRKQRNWSIHIIDASKGGPT